MCLSSIVRNNGITTVIFYRLNGYFYIGLQAESETELLVSHESSSAWRSGQSLRALEEHSNGRPVPSLTARTAATWQKAKGSGEI